MVKVTLRFPTISDMIDFESLVPTYGHLKDRINLTIAGYFEESQIELAKSGFNATVTEDNE